LLKGEQQVFRYKKEREKEKKMVAFRMATVFVLSLNDLLYSIIVRKINRNETKYEYMWDT